MSQYVAHRRFEGDGLWQARAVRDLRDRVAVVTGGASGIGRALAERFASAGARLVLADVEEAALAATVADLEAAGASAVGVVADVARVADVEAVRDRALAEFGAVHVVCNNAGVGGGGIIDAPLALWEWTIGVNLMGVVHGVHVFLPLLLEQDVGHVVNTASLAGLGGVAGLGIYCTTKFAVVGLSESLHHDLAARGSSVGVSVLCPGFVQTRIGESARNAPATLDEWTNTPAAAVTREFANALAAAGIPPAVVADAVHDAILDGTFFVLPHEHAALATTRARLDWMGGGAPPANDPTRAVQP
jgi:NAD(P)-dependent dehydrogenase (short-subunit alcohol dehydrogenase family)